MKGEKLVWDVWDYLIVSDVVASLLYPPWYHFVKNKKQQKLLPYSVSPDLPLSCVVHTDNLFYWGAADLTQFGCTFCPVLCFYCACIFYHLCFSLQRKQHFYLLKRVNVFICAICGFLVFIDTGCWMNRGFSACTVNKSRHVNLY